jgi:3-(3-hydroxy-phenyl)propionate hydroxylase
VRLGSVVMTTSPGRARARDALVRALARLGPARRYLEEMRFFPRQRYTDGFVAPGGDDVVGRALPQPRVLRPAGQVERLDEVLGEGFALLAVDVPGAAVPADPFWRRLDPRLVVVSLDDRFPQDDATARVADFDGTLREALAGLAGRYVLVRPDRYVAAVFAPPDAGTIERMLQTAWGTPHVAAVAPATT